MPAPRWMIYGATGYTGRLVVREAVARGAAPILAGRGAGAVAAMALEHGLEHRAFGLDEPEALRGALAGVAAVLHCAGPFAWTSRPMVDACLATRTHYLDITGEIDVFEAIHARDAAAREAGVVLLPGVGFDVVPTDCLAARLASEVPGPASLELAFHAAGGGVSRGTLRSMVERMPKAGAVRRDGELEAVPIAWETREIEFGCGTRWTMTIPWGDVSTAWVSTGIPNIKVFVGMSPGAITRARRLRRLAPIIGLKPVKRAAQWIIGRRVTGPSASERSAGRSYLWGRVLNARGRGAVATFDTPEGYTLTAVAAVDAALRVVAGEVGDGAMTPSLALGKDYVETLPGVSKIVVHHDG